MAADEMQVRLTAKDDLTKELTRATKAIAKLEAQLNDLGDATGPEAERDVRRLTHQLEKAQDRAKIASGAVTQLDHDIDQMGGSAKRAGANLDKTTASVGKGKSSMVAFGGAMTKGAVAAGAVAAAAVGMGLAIKKAAEITYAAAQQAVSYEKKVRRTDIVFGKFSDRVRKWADANNESFGSSVEDVASFAASIGDILKPLGFTTREATKLSLGVGDLVPALAEWNTKGMDAVAVTDALTAAMTGEREMLKSLGIVIMEEDVQAKVKAMEAAGKFTDETEKQRKAIATLKLAVEGSTDALSSYKGNSDSAGRAVNRLRANVADLKDAGLDIVAEAIRRVARSMGILGNKDDTGALQWMADNREVLIDALIAIAGTTAKTAAAFFRLGNAIMAAVSATLGTLGAMLEWMPGRLGEWGRQLSDAADAAWDTGAALGELSKDTNQLGDDILNATGRTDAFISSLQTLKNAGASKKVQDASRNMPINDTRVPMGVGSLGAGGLAAAHAAYSSQLGGHSIMSGVRGTGLGSVHSDHRYGRAMDVQGPRLGAYAQVVRRNGGYAAMHGAGGNRHLHVVPQTRRPAPVATGGNTFHADVTVVNPAQQMDIQGAVARGLRDAARQTRERG